MRSRPSGRLSARGRPAGAAPRALERALAEAGAFDISAFLGKTGVARRLLRLRKGAVVYAQGDRAETVMYLQDGRVGLSVLSSGGKEAVVGLMGPGDFFGEGCLAGQSVRMGSATAMAATTVLAIGRQAMADALHQQRAFSDVFIAYVLARNIRIEEDLVDQLFNSSEKRLARTLLLLSRYGKAEESHHVLPKLSQQTLAEIVGTTRSRVNLFMNKFRKLGFIEYNDGIHVNHSLLSVVLHD
jgi:CRP/FNR family cyclic AMP-dependent transcriptional regulator